MERFIEDICHMKGIHSSLGYPGPTEFVAVLRSGLEEPSLLKSFFCVLPYYFTIDRQRILGTFLK